MSNTDIKEKTEENISTEITKISKEEITTDKGHDQEEYQDTSFNRKKRNMLTFFSVKYQ